MLSSIENYYERLVIECIRETFQGTEQMTDTDYLDDLACVTLNELPPRYVRYSVDLASHLSDDAHQAMRQETAEALKQAIETIARRSSAREDGSTTRS